VRAGPISNLIDFFSYGPFISQKASRNIVFLAGLNGKGSP
jgi:hypothetical protein